jgi:hypothetical protein
MEKKYLIRFLALITIVILFLDLSAQQEQYVIRRNLEWQPSKEIQPGHTILIFEGATNHDSLGFLPVCQVELPEIPAGSAAEAHLTDVIYEPFKIDDPLDYPDIDLIRDEAQVIISSFTSQKIVMQAAYIMPLRRSNESGGFERLVSFGLSVQIEKDKSNLSIPNITAGNYASHSVLRSGDWYRISVGETGIYKIDYNDLVGMGIDPEQTDPRNIRLYGNGNGMLDESNSVPRIDDLIENSIFIEGEDDGTFDPEDFIVFYGKGPVTLKYNSFYLQYEHEINFYTDETFYFLTVGEGPGKRVLPGGVYTQEPTHHVYNFQDLAWHEKEEVNLLKSGKVWYGEVFNTQVDYTFPFNLEGIDTSEPTYLKLNLAARSTTKTVFNTSVNGEFLLEMEVPSVVLGSQQVYARPIISNYELINLEGESANIDISFVKPGTIDVAWMNYIEINYVRHLNFEGGQLSFRDMRPVGPGNVARYHIQTSNPALNIWAVSKTDVISSQLISEETNGIYFQYPSSDLQEFIAFDGAQYLSAKFIEKVANQDLHALPSANYIIIAHPNFTSQAERLADYHREYNGMSVHVVSPQQIYNEFSSGAQDVSAIRDFMKMLYERTTGDPLRYLLLFGDASYDYKDITHVDNNLVPTYEARETLKPAASFVTDDFFGCLDPDEGSGGSGTMDIGVGRFPVHTVEQAEAMVTKSINYMTPKRENFGPWRNSICFVGDDEDNNTHLGQAEGLVEITETLGPVYNVSKVYLDAYPQLKTPSGSRYPDANVAIDKAVNDGSLIINYTGHGGEIAWAEERVLDIPAIQSYRNSTHLPAFVTATCEFSRYDDPSLVSAGELVFLNPDGAGIGLFTTTRLAFSQSNYALNKRFYDEAFIIDSLTGEYPRMGDLIRVAKTPSNQNIKNFVLLGDPALMLAYPKMRVSTVEIINDGDGRVTDTIQALSRVTITGQVEDTEGNLLENFNGLVYPSVFDKPVKYQTRGNDPASKITDFYIQDKKIYEGKASVTNGKFSFTFICPLDISYQVGEGKISYYALDTNQLIDAHGYDQVMIGGSDELAVADTEGPGIELYLNTLSFVSGDLTTPSPMLIAMLSDSSGINTVGNGIGHDIVAIVDGNYQEPIILNDYFDPETDSYQAGEILYRLGPFADGMHVLTLKAWDVLNNSSEKSIEFEVDNGARLSLSQLSNSPNPYRDYTQFEFMHNKPGFGLDVHIMIYSLTGQHMTSLYYTIHPESTESGPLYWDGRDASGNELSSGLYVYRVLVESDDGYFSSLSQKFFHFK